MSNKASIETQEQALKVAKGTQKQGQTKAQTKLIAQGIEKGIAEYKKQQSKKSRERDKERKQQIKHKQRQVEEPVNSVSEYRAQKLPWILLAVSWLGFISFSVYTLNL
ncbi:DUF2956 domain-containing protein [Colwellia echini]|uniref:DUF2956 domain-containing protein n=1 Tax=Colwellia echini TaxID=1982103 RepID=A0ABY3MWH9_9GAMM|nr:DUF2956 domain-containing protein [Colwellia echini]TYK65563.1 DUF2956 domain-containing protein [Colwellia echini]